MAQILIIVISFSMFFLISSQASIFILSSSFFSNSRVSLHSFSVSQFTNPFIIVLVRSVVSIFSPSLSSSQLSAISLAKDGSFLSSEKYLWNGSCCSVILSRSCSVFLSRSCSVFLSRSCSVIVSRSGSVFLSRSCSVFLSRSCSVILSCS